MKSYWVYILTNQHDSVLCIGMTSGLRTRMAQHRGGQVKGFTKRYNLKKLVYVEEFSEVRDAIAREKQLKTGAEGGRWT